MQPITDLILRPFKPTDIDALIELFRLSVRRGTAEHYSHAQRIAWAPDVIDREHWLNKQQNKQTWVASLNHTMAGFADLEPDGHIDMLFVHPDFYRRGIATLLLEKLEQEAKRQSISRLFVEASLTAYPVFENAGFSVNARQTVHHNGQDFINFRMEKILQNY